MSIAILVFMVLVGIAALIHVFSLTPAPTWAPETVRSDESRRLDRQAARQRYLNR